MHYVPNFLHQVINPVYSAFIANKNPEICPLGAFAFYHHYIHDVMDISDTLKTDWTKNKSWRQVAVLHGPKSPNTPYSEQNLYNLYCRAYTSAGFSSRLKAHLPRHLLGYRQEAIGQFWERLGIGTTKITIHPGNACTYPNNSLGSPVQKRKKLAEVSPAS
ncbi:hypothetical protein C8J57DRAFT_1511728 [Mycena rebaudengoi]|nr:hypothetical protein C8J57DRAFT_1511728 [Mycena rebaudengoi]